MDSPGTSSCAVPMAEIDASPTDGSSVGASEASKEVQLAALRQQLAAVQAQVAQLETA